jgi:hypothetical protein
MMEKYGRITISVPNALKARMEAIGDKANWSRLAREAFEKELRKHEIDANWGDVLDRIRATKDRPGDGELGRKWAKDWIRDHATYTQLDSVFQFGEITPEIADTAFAGFPQSDEVLQGFTEEVREFWSAVRDTI